MADLDIAGGEVRLDDVDRLATRRVADRIEIAVVDDLARTMIVRVCPDTALVDAGEDDRG